MFYKFVDRTFGITMLHVTNSTIMLYISLIINASVGHPFVSTEAMLLFGHREWIATSGQTRCSEHSQSFSFVFSANQIWWEFLWITDFQCWTRGCYSWCWPKGAQPLETRMWKSICFGGSCIVLPPSITDFIPDRVTISCKMPIISMCLQQFQLVAVCEMSFSFGFCLAPRVFQVLQFSTLHKNQTFQIPVQPG